MTPRELDTDVVAARLQLMHDLLDDLESVGEVSAEVLSKDRLRRHAVERILAQLVEMATSINSHVASVRLGKVAGDYRQSFDVAVDAGLLPAELAQTLKPSVGLRNVLTHEYLDTDLGIVAGAVEVALSDYRRYTEVVAAWLTRH